MYNETFIIIDSMERFDFWIRLKEIKKIKVFTIKESIFLVCKKNNIKCIKFNYKNTFSKTPLITKKIKSKTSDIFNNYLKKKSFISLVSQVKSLKINKSAIFFSWSDTNLLLNCFKYVYSKNKYIHLEVANINDYLFIDKKGVNRNSELYEHLKKSSIRNKLKKIPNKLYHVKKLRINKLLIIYDLIDLLKGKSFYSIKFFTHIFLHNIFSLFNSFLIKMLSNNKNIKANTLIIGQLSKDWNMHQYNMTNIKIIKYFLKNKKREDIAVFKPHPKEVSFLNLIELYFFCKKNKIFFSSKYFLQNINKIYTHTSSHVYNFMNSNKKVIFISDSLQKEIYNKGLTKKILSKYFLKINYYSNKRFKLNNFINVH